MSLIQSHSKSRSLDHLAPPLDIGTNLSLLPSLAEADSIVDGPTARVFAGAGEEMRGLMSLHECLPGNEGIRVFAGAGGGNESHAAGCVGIGSNADCRWMPTPRVQTKSLEKSPGESAKMTEEQYETSTRQSGEGGGAYIGAGLRRRRCLLRCPLSADLCSQDFH